MRFIAKFGIGFYLIISLLFKLSFIIPPSLVEVLYQILMGSGVILFFRYSNLLFEPKNKKAFGVFYFIVFFNILYTIVFTYNTESILYILAKFSMANLIAFGLITNYDFYKQFFIKYFKYIIGVVLLLGYFFSGIESNTDGVQRLSIGFNPNDVGLFGALGFISILFFNNKWYKSIKEIIFLMVFLLLTLLSGSKAALLNIIIGAVFIYGFKPKIIATGILFLVVVNIIPKFGYTTSIDRLSEETDVLASRDETNEAGLLTFKDAFFEGHGIDKYEWTDPMYWDNPNYALGPHNTYLATGIMYGVIFGAIFTLMLLTLLIRAIKLNYNHNDVFAKFCALIVVLTIINGFFETLIVGINEFITVLFWFAMGIVGYYKLNYKTC